MFIICYILLFWVRLLMWSENKQIIGNGLFVHFNWSTLASFLSARFLFCQKVAAKHTSNTYFFYLPVCFLLTYIFSSHNQPDDKFPLMIPSFLCPLCFWPQWRWVRKRKQPVSRKVLATRTNALLTQDSHRHQEDTFQGASVLQSSQTEARTPSFLIKNK